MMGKWAKTTSIVALAALGATQLTACGSSSAASAKTSSAPLTATSQVMNWFAEPEQGGQWDAQINGYYRQAGLAMTTRQGGPPGVGGAVGGKRKRHLWHDLRR
jgi:NitT/TauT family transport system substrate-binding protein